MTIDVSAILKELGGKVTLNGTVCLNDIGFLGGTYSFKEPVNVLGDISNNGKSLILRAKCAGTMLTQCARCMKEITVPIAFKLDENLVQGDDGNSYDEDVIVFAGTAIEIDGIVADGFLMNVGGKYLCREDCRGLCPHCGADLNEGECGCDSDTIDPRWAALVDIMKNNE